jgi:hypothetical protein
MQQRPEWLIAPDMTPGARLEISGLIEADALTPEVLELLAKFARKLERLEKDKPPIDPCPTLDTCLNYHKACTVLAHCGVFSVKAALS